jgi:hypothetical protein
LVCITETFFTIASVMLIMIIKLTVKSHLPNF